MFVLGLFFLILSQVVQALYVQPNLDIEGCEWAVLGTPAYVVLPYGKYAFIVSMSGLLGIYNPVVNVLDLESGTIVTTIEINGVTGTDQTPFQVLLCPKERRLVIFGLTGRNYAVVDISDPEHLVIIKLSK